MNQAKYMQIVIFNTITDLIIIGLFYFKVLVPDMDMTLRLMVCGILALNLVIVPLVLKLAVKD
jgi:ABC-type phosphate transport system permease subunit